MKFKVRLRFHGDLSVFLQSGAGDAVIERSLAEKTSVKDITNGEASRAQRLTATGAFCALVGFIVAAIALLSFIVALV